MNGTSEAASTGNLQLPWMQRMAKALALPRSCRQSDVVQELSMRPFIEMVDCDRSGGRDHYSRGQHDRTDMCLGYDRQGAIERRRLESVLARL